VRHPAIGRYASPLLIGSVSRPGQPGPRQPGARAPNGRLALVVLSSLALGSRASFGIAACAQHSDNLLSIGFPKPLAREARTRAEERRPQVTDRSSGSSARLRSRLTVGPVGRVWVELDLGYATVLAPLLLVGRSQADDDVVEGQPHGVEPDLPVRIQRRELPASLDPHLTGGVPRHRSGAAGLTRPPRRSATGRDAALGKALAAAVAYNVLWIAVSAANVPQRRQYPSWWPPTLVSASLSASVARSRLLVWWWLAHCEVEGQLVGAAIGQVHPLAAVWAHQVGGPRTAAKGLDDLLLLGRHLHPSPTVFYLQWHRRRS
jgi:hypothetical protein